MHNNQKNLAHQSQLSNSNQMPQNNNRRPAAGKTWCLLSIQATAKGSHSYSPQRLKYSEVTIQAVEVDAPSNTSASMNVDYRKNY